MPSVISFTLVQYIFLSTVSKNLQFISTQSNETHFRTTQDDWKTQHDSLFNAFENKWDNYIFELKCYKCVLKFLFS